MSLSDRTGPLRARPRPLGFKNGDLKASAAAEVTAAEYLGYHYSIPNSPSNLV